LVLALFAFARRYASARTAALVSVVAGALGLAALAGRDGGSGVVPAMALALSGAALVLRSEGRSPAVAAGLFWAAAVASLGFPRAIAPALLVATLLLAARGREAMPRLVLAGGFALILAAPALWRTAEPPSLSSLEPMAPALLLAVAAAGVAIAFSKTEWRWTSGRGAPAVAGVVVLVAFLGEWTLRGARVEVAPDLLAVAGWARERSRPLDRLCTDDEAARAWLPALAARAVHRPRLGDGRLFPAVDAGESPCPFQVSRKGTPSPPFTPSFRSGRFTVSRRLPRGSPAETRR
jgi:hypothetical protein